MFGEKNLSSDDYVSCFKLHSAGSVLYFLPYIMIYMPRFEQGELTISRSFHFCCNCCEDIIIQHRLQNFLLHFNEDFTRRVGLGSFSSFNWSVARLPLINFTASFNSNSQPWPLSKSKMKCIYIHYIYIILNYKLPNFCLGCYKSNLQSVALSDRWLKLFPIINMVVVKLQILF